MSSTVPAFWGRSW